MYLISRLAFSLPAVMESLVPDIKAGQGLVASCYGELGNSHRFPKVQLQPREHAGVGSVTSE